MNFNKFTIKAQEAIQEAVKQAGNHGQQVIEPVHIMGGVLKSNEQIVSFLLQKTGTNVKKVETEVKPIAWRDYISPADLAVVILDRKLEERKINLKGANVVVAGGYGMGSKEGFKLCYDLAEVLGAEVGASRAATDAGYCEHERMIGQTGITVRPKLYIACGISGQVQHTVGMDSSSIIVSINSDADAPINKIADYAIVGKVEEVIPKMIKYYKQNSK